MNHAQAIALHYPLLHAVAYKLVKSKEDAEDIVQDTLVKLLHIDLTAVENLRAYLVRAVTNNCINYLKALKRKKEEIWDSIHVAEFVERLKENHLPQIDIEAEVAHAWKVLQHKLEPVERAVYVLKEVFDFDYDALTEVFGKKKEHVRQLVCRARKKLSDETARITHDMPSKATLLQSFRNACDMEQIQEFVSELKRDISSTLSKKK